MNDIYLLLERIEQLLSELFELLHQEEKELSYFKVNAIALQSLADRKHRIITSLHFYDKERCRLAQVKEISPPYSSYADLSHIWSKIEEKTKSTADLYERINFLIDRQMKNIKVFQSTVKELQQEHSLYESGGDKEHTSATSFFHISV